MDPYKILGIDPSASRERIEAAYREKARKHHPDKGGDTWAFQQVQAAYEEIRRQSERGTASTEAATNRATQTQNTAASSETGQARIPPNKRQFDERWGFACAIVLLLLIKFLGSESARKALVSQIVSVVLLGVATLLWIAFTVVAGLAIAFAARAYRDTEVSERKQNASFAAFLVFLCGVLWFILGWFPLNREPSRSPTSTSKSGMELAQSPAPAPAKVIELPPNASPEQLTAAYKSRVYYVLVSYTDRRVKQYLFSSQVETAPAQVCGSGIMIANDHSQGIIVTNRHVIDPVYAASQNGATVNPLNIRVQVKSPLMASFRDARVAAIHHQRDLALLLINDTFKTSEAVRVVRMQDVRQAEPALALGNPLGLEFFVSTGIVSGSAEHMLGVTCPINHGNSGGPLFLYRHGWLAGINTLGGGQNLNFAEPAECLLPGAINAWKIQSDHAMVRRLLNLVPVASGP